MEACVSCFVVVTIACEEKRLPHLPSCIQACKDYTYLARMLSGVSDLRSSMFMLQVSFLKGLQSRLACALSQVTNAAGKRCYLLPALTSPVMQHLTCQGGLTCGSCLHCSCTIKHQRTRGEYSCCCLHEPSLDSSIRPSHVAVLVHTLLC